MMRIALPLLLPFLTLGCSTSGAGDGSARPLPFAGGSISICSGYGCVYRDGFSPSAAERNRLRAIMNGGAASAAAERRAVGRAIADMETIARRHARFAADEPLSLQRNSGVRGQMDCYDESLNTRTYLRWLAGEGLLTHHTVLGRIGQRGLILDGRYPHKTALIREKGGTVWAVDSWRGRSGQPPEIMPLDRWQSSDSSDFPYRPTS